MNKTLKTVTKLESLPNEILLEVFTYLNAYELVCLFDHLNYRFYKLIRSIKLHFDFEHVRKSTFDRCCKTILNNSEIRNQICSLHLSNENQYEQIEMFLSSFSNDEFCQLQSLALTDVKTETMEKLKSMISSMTELRSLRLNCHAVEAEVDAILRCLTTSKLQTLDIYADLFNYGSFFFAKCLPITNLKLLSIDLWNLHDILTYLSVLKSLYIGECSPIDRPHGKKGTMKPYQKFCAVHLKTMFIHDFGCEFVKFKNLVVGMPNLRNLTVFAQDFDIDMMDAYEWEHLITSSLPHLKIFKFRFIERNKKAENQIKTKFEQFQSDFWHKKHHWYIEYLSTVAGICIYTISCPLYACALNFDIETYDHDFTSNFCNYWEHSLSREQELKEKHQFYFSKVLSLTFYKRRQSGTSPVEIKHIDTISTLVNLFWLTNLEISPECEIETPSVLSYLLKQAPHLSSIHISQQLLLTLLKDNELCDYLNKMVKKLYLHCNDDTEVRTLNNYAEFRQFLKTFANIEDLQYNIRKKVEVKYLLYNLPKLSNLTINMYTSENVSSVSTWFRKELSKFNASYEIDDSYVLSENYVIEIKVWMG